ncbi:MAG: DUF1385 domain-containing protein [Anaerotardibacter sp.]
MGKSEANRAFLEDGANKTHIGGQALIEGVMMRGKTHWSVVVRDGVDSYYSECNPLSKKQGRPKICQWPFVRGCVALFDSLMLGYKALEVSATHAFMEWEIEEDSKNKGSDKDSKGESSEESFLDADGKNNASQDTTIKDNLSAKERETADDDTFGTKEMIISAILGITLGVALFILAPAAISNLLIGDYDSNPFLWNCVDGVCRVAVFVFYVWLIGRMKDIKRMFAYHGAEHKAIHCFEHGLELTPENARKFPRLHVRCGTAFLIMVMIIAILVYTLIPLDGFILWLGVEDSTLKFLIVLACRLLFLPLIAGVSYEITVKWAGSHPDNPLVKIILWPGMQMQYLTTNEPDDTQLYCALKALEIVANTEENPNSCSC